MTRGAERPPRPPYCVLLRSPDALDFRAVCAVVGARTGLAPETLLPVLRRGWGVLPQPSAAEGAEAMAAALVAAGQPAVAVPTSLVEPLPKPVSVTRGSLSGDGFDVEDGRAGAARERLLWSRLAALSAGAVTERVLKTGRKARGARDVEEERRSPFIELCFSEPPRRLRILGSEFDYSALGPKMSYSTELNFRALVEELAARAPGARRSKGARALLAKAPSGESAYESFDDAAAELRWLVALHQLKL